MATRSLGTLTVDLLVRMGGFKQGMDQAARESDKAARKIRGTFNQLRGILGGVLAGFSFAQIVRATAEAERAFGQLRNAVETNAGAAGKTADELAAVAGELQSITTYSDDAIQQMQALLLRFKGIGETRFDEATKATLDLATALGQDLQSAARLVGLALDNPVEGLSRLSRLGVVFSKEQKEVIKTLVDTGKAAEAQGIILRELEGRFGGAAEAARGTFAGALEGVKNAFGDLLEVKTGIPAATDALNEFAKLLEDPRTKQAADSLFSVLIAGATKTAKAFTDLVGIARFAGEQIAAIRFGPAAGDSVRIEDEIARVRNALENQVPRFGGRIEIFGRNGLFKWYSEAELQAELKRLEGLLADYGQNPSAGGRPPPTAGIVGAPDFDLEASIGDRAQARAAAVVDELEKVRDAHRAVLEAGLAAIEGLDTPVETQIRQYQETKYALEQLRDTYPGLADAADEALERLRVADLEPITITAEKIFPKQEREELNVFFEEASRGFQNLLADFLFNPFEDGIKGMLKSFGDMLLRMAAEAAAAQIAQKLFGTGVGTSGGSAGGWLQMAGNLFMSYWGGGSMNSQGIGLTSSQISQAFKGLSGGGYTGDGGKYDPAGVVHRGEFVARSEVVRQPGAREFLDSFNRVGMAALSTLPGFASGGFVGGAGLDSPIIVPAVPRGATSGMAVNNYFTIQAPQGTVSRATETQIAAAAARGAGRASARNN